MIHNDVDIRSICDNFVIDGTYQGYVPIKVGNVNQTYTVDYRRTDGSVQTYLLQKVNTYAFRKPLQLMHNVKLITDHMHAKDPDRRMIHYEFAKDGNPYVGDDINFWRIYNFIPAVTYGTPENDSMIREAGDAFGTFQRLLNDFDTNSLYETIPGFHNTPQRIENLRRDAAEDTCGRLAEVQDLYDEILSLAEQAFLLQHLRDAGELPVRVTHNDTKLNNVLFDIDTGKSITVIDLDTVMPGLVAYDFGDAIRFMANVEAEDSPNWEQAKIDMHIYEVFAQGFLAALKGILTTKEIETLSYGPFVLALELASRFLDDYLNGDKYFTIDYPEHNLVRTRCQLALAKDCLRKREEMQRIIDQALK